MTMTMMIIALMVLFSALLIGKMLKEILAERDTQTDTTQSHEARTPAE